MYPYTTLSRERILNIQYAAAPVILGLKSGIQIVIHVIASSFLTVAFDLLRL